MTDAVRILVRQPLVVVGMLLFVVGLLASQWEPPDYLTTRTEVAIVLVPAVPGGLALLFIGMLLALTELRESRSDRDDGTTSRRQSIWTRALRGTGALTFCTVAWWIVGWLLVVWIVVAVDGWMALGFWPTSVAE